MSKLISSSSITLLSCNNRSWMKCKVNNGEEPPNGKTKGYLKNRSHIPNVLVECISMFPERNCRTRFAEIYVTKESRFIHVRCLPRFLKLIEKSDSLRQNQSRL